MEWGRNGASIQKISVSLLLSNSRLSYNISILRRDGEMDEAIGESSKHNKVDDDSDNQRLKERHADTSFQAKKNLSRRFRKLHSEVSILINLSL